MSSDCIYKEAVIRVSPEFTGLEEDQYLVIGLYGSSNCYDMRNRRSRSWSINNIGNHQSVIANGISAAQGFEGKYLYHKCFGSSGALRGSDWIKKVRNMLKRAITLTEMDGVMINTDYIQFHFKQDCDKESQFRLLFSRAKEMELKKTRYNGFDILKISGPTI